MNKRFEAYLNEAGLPLTDEQLDQFHRYRELIKAWNARIDITAITDDADIDNRHFLDSLSIFKYAKIPSGASVIDIGTGGGFPGIPMKLYDPSLRLTLLDSLNKRILFLDEVVEQLSLEHVRTLHARAEEAMRTDDHRDRYDIAISRAVAPLATLLEYCLPAVRVGGTFYAMKGPNCDEEIRLAKPALDALGGRIVATNTFDWTDEHFTRTIIAVKKLSPTPKKYPRGQGKPRKSPLVLN